MRIMVVGAYGMLGSEIMSLLKEDEVYGYDLPDFDVTNASSVASTVKALKPEVIINTSAITDVDYCETNPDAAEMVHHIGVKNLASTGVRLVTISTDHVFSDGRGRPLLESDKPEPVNVYAVTKLRGEIAALGNPDNIVVRTSWLFAKRGMLPRILKKLSHSGTVTAVTDQTSCVTWAPSLAGILVDLVYSDYGGGIYHCVNPGAVTPYDIALALYKRIGTGRVVPTRWKDLNLPAPRPVWSVLGTGKTIYLPPMSEVLETWLKQML